MRIAFGSDEKTPLVDHVVSRLRSAGNDVKVVGEGKHWIDVGRAVGEAVTVGGADRGIVCCWTGTGVSIAANKVAGVRAALCTDAETARGARQWGDANVLALSLRLVTPALSDEIIDAFLTTEVDESERGQIARLD